MTKEELESGVLLLIDKPKGWTSFDVIAKLRGILKIRKIGHAGTLDPMATGLLLVCTGKWTKKIDGLQAQIKTYEGTITLGASTATYDAESEPHAFFDWEHLKLDDIREAISSFIGEIDQLPPAFSAIKVNGKRAYDLARKGISPELKPRSVHIYSYEILSYEAPEINFRVVCSKGTYIRSLAHDLGVKLNNGAYLSRLVRTAIGEYTLDQAKTIEMLQAEVTKNRVFNSTTNDTSADA